jgi:hypothetical protein
MTTRGSEDDPFVEDVREARAKRRRDVKEMVQRALKMAPLAPTPKADAELLLRLEKCVVAAAAAGRNLASVRLGKPAIGAMVPVDNDLGDWWAGVIKWHRDLRTLVNDIYFGVEETTHKRIDEHCAERLLAACDHVLEVWNTAHPRMAARTYRGPDQRTTYGLEICVAIE